MVCGWAVCKVVWSVPEDSLIQVRGFQVRYQAVGSNVVQYSRILSSSTFSHHITRLHENTAYDVCVNILTVDEVRPPRYLSAARRGADYVISCVWLYVCLCVITVVSKKLLIKYGSLPNYEQTLLTHLA